MKTTTSTSNKTTPYEDGSNETGDEVSVTGSGVASAINKIKDEDESETKIGSDETRQVKKLRFLVLAVLVACTIGVAIAVYRYVDASEQQAFEQAFYGNSEKIMESIGSTLDVTLGSLDTLQVSMVSHAKATGQKWPFVTIPDFAVHAEKVRSMSKSLFVFEYLLVEEEERRAWEEYSGKVCWWCSKFLVYCLVF